MSSYKVELFDIYPTHTNRRSNIFDSFEEAEKLYNELKETVCDRRSVLIASGQKSKWKYRDGSNFIEVFEFLPNNKEGGQFLVEETKIGWFFNSKSKIISLNLEVIHNTQ